MGNLIGVGHGPKYRSVGHGPKYQSVGRGPKEGVVSSMASLRGE